MGKKDGCVWEDYDDESWCAKKVVDVDSGEEEDVDCLDVRTGSKCKKTDGCAWVGYDDDESWCAKVEDVDCLDVRTESKCEKKDGCAWISYDDDESWCAQKYRT